MRHIVNWSLVMLLCSGCASERMTGNHQSDNTLPRRETYRPPQSSRHGAKIIKCESEDEIKITESFGTFVFLGECKHITIIGDSNQIFLSASIGTFISKGSYNKIVNKGIITGATEIGGDHNIIINEDLSISPEGRQPQGAK